MTNLKLNEEETLILRNVLKNYLGELRMEISNTDNMRYKEMLYERKRALDNICKKLECEDTPEPES